MRRRVSGEISRFTPEIVFLNRVRWLGHGLLMAVYRLPFRALFASAGRIEVERIQGNSLRFRHRLLLSVFAN